ncbi:MAG TPA: lipid II flippase MurJ [Pilimelia sp.]|nr:lipid II flippase MurJ [Pilimelia sp.]
MQAGQPHGDDRESAAVARNSLAVASWTAVSRVSGFVRIAVIAAVLGPTYLGNIFQAMSTLPMLMYAALTGSLFSSLLVPSLVKHVDAGDVAATRRLAGAFLTTALAAFGVAATLIVLAGPWVLRLLTAGVADPAAAESQRRIGLVLLIMFIPQLLLYGVVGTAEAVMNAHGRFALASAAPVLENLGIIATMIATAIIFGTGDALASPSPGALLLLGLGTTAAVALHAGTQWWGAWRVGVPLLPGRGWREPEMRSIVRRAVPSLGYSTLDVLLPFGATVVANRTPGGVLAFQFAFLCCTLPTALGARPVAVSLLPRLSRLFHAGDLQRFRDELVRGASLVAFLAVPAALALVVLAEPIAGAVTFGRMATAQGQGLIAVALASLGPAVVGYAAMLLGTYACYARDDAHTPLRAVLIRTGVVIAGLSLAFGVPAGAAALIALGLTVSAGNLAGGFWLAARLRRVLPPSGAGMLRPFLRTAAAAALMVVPAYLVARYLPYLLSTRWSPQIVMLATAATATSVFLVVQRLWGSPELAQLRDGLRDGGRSVP